MTVPGRQVTFETGHQYVVAFEDRNRNARYDADEPVAHYSLSSSGPARYPAFGRIDLVLSDEQVARDPLSSP